MKKLGVSKINRFCKGFSLSIQEWVDTYYPTPSQVALS